MLWHCDAFEKKVQAISVSSQFKLSIPVTPFLFYNSNRNIIHSALEKSLPQQYVVSFSLDKDKKTSYFIINSISHMPAFNEQSIMYCNNHVACTVIKPAVMLTFSVISPL